MDKKFRTWVVVLVVILVVILVGWALLKKMSPNNSQGVSPSVSLSSATTTASAIEVGRIAINQNDAIALQDSVNQGHQPWRLDPEMVLAADLPQYGFVPVDLNSPLATDLTAPVQVAPPRSGTVQYQISHTGSDNLVRFYLVTLIQPASTTIWTLSDIEPNTLPIAESIPVPNIPAPPGWQAEPQSLGFTMFVGQGANGGRIDVGAVKTGQTLEHWIATNYNGNFPYATLTATSSLSGSEAETWAVVNGHLVLVDSSLESESPAGRVLDYSVFDNGNVYIFTLMAYQLYDPTTQTYFINQPGVQTLKAMVQNFVASLPLEQ